MLSYLHSFHAGNFADVLKHLTTVEILNYLTQKPKPLLYVDTHSGAGAYSLDKAESQKNKEYEYGIAALEQATDLPPAVQNYVDLVKQFNKTIHGSEIISHYPGSPWFAQELLTSVDRLSLFELHPREFQTLQKNMQSDRRIQTFNSDGFHACKSQLPPKEKRGYILIDPPYEVKQDYKTVVQAIEVGHKKFSTGTFALWYPVVERHRVDQLEKALIQTGIKNIQLFELGIQADSSARGMTASGMIVINPPWTLMNTLQNCLPYLAKKLGGDQGHFKIKQLVAE